MGSTEVDIEIEAGVNKWGLLAFLEVDKLEVSCFIFFILSYFFYSFDIKLGFRVLLGKFAIRVFAYFFNIVNCYY